MYYIIWIHSTYAYYPDLAPSDRPSSFSDREPFMGREVLNSRNYGAKMCCYARALSLRILRVYVN